MCFLSVEEFEYDIMLSHDWGLDEHGRNNHERVVKVARMLQERGIRVWIDQYVLLNRRIR